VDDEGNIYEWNYQHGAVEKYSEDDKHRGEYDAETGTQNSQATPSASRRERN
jgi:hypothetical protein